jgi:ABC-type transporter Mla MlaB component
MAANGWRPRAEARASPATQPIARRWRPGPGGTVLIMLGPVPRDGIPALCERARRLLAGCDAGPLSCDVDALANPDAATIDALARLQLTALRLGHRVELQRARGPLVELLVLSGLSGVLRCAGSGPRASRVQAWREPEHREQALGVQEEADPDDPAVGDLQDLE